MRKTLFILLCFFSMHYGFGMGGVFFSPDQSHGQTPDDKLAYLGQIKKKYLYDDPDKAIAIAKTIFEDSEDDVVRFKAVMLISTAHSSERDYKDALSSAIRALSIAKRLNSDGLKIQSYNRLGGIYHQLKVYDKSIQYLDKAEKLCRAQDHMTAENHFQLASNFIIRGFVYKDKLNCDIAISFFDKGIKEYLKIPGKRKNGNISIAAYNKGNCYTLLQNYNAAISSYEYANRIAVDANANSLSAFALKGLANVYTLQGKYHKALGLLEQAKSISEKVGDLVLDREIYRGLSENYLALKDRKNYKKYNKLYLDYRLKVKKSERQSISNSINRIIKDKNEGLNRAETGFSTLVKLLGAGVVLLIFLTIVLIRREKKATSRLRNTIKSTLRSRRS